MDSNINVWMLCAIIPVIMANYIFPVSQEVPHHGDDVVSILVAQVKDLQRVVTEQGHRIASLEKRLEERESAVNPRPGPIDDKHHGNEEHTEGEVGDDGGQQLTTSDNDEDETPGPLLGDDVHTRVGNQNARSLSRGIRASENVAFSSFLDHPVTDMGLGQTVKCNQVLLNDGNHYNTHSGTFTAPVSGVYFFTYYIYDDHDKAAVQLVVDDKHIAEAIVYPYSGHGVMGGNSAILPVSAGQAVWLQTRGWNDSDIESYGPEHLVTFSGYLIYSTQN